MKYLILAALLLAACGKQTKIVPVVADPNIHQTMLGPCICEGGPYTTSQAQAQYCSAIGYGYLCPTLTK